MKKIKVVTDPKIDVEYKDSKLEKWIHELNIKIKDGEEFTYRVEYPIGDFNNPFDRESLPAKKHGNIPL